MLNMLSTQLSRPGCCSSETCILTSCVTSVVYILRRPLMMLECEPQLSIQSLSMPLTPFCEGMQKVSLLTDVGYCIKPEQQYSEGARIALWHLFTPINLSLSSIGISSRDILLAMLVIYPSQASLAARQWAPLC